MKLAAPLPALLAILAIFAISCASAPRGLERAGTPAAVSIAAARARGGERGFTFHPFSPAAFAEAKRDRKLILLDGAAEWCHWCHVMDETTYRDPEVGRILRERFVAIRADVDEHPDLAERYGAWGWPATIVLSPDAEEIGKYRGYLPPHEMRALLSQALEASAQTSNLGRREIPDLPARVEALPYIAGRALLDLDGWWDPDQGSWGKRQKAPLGANIEFEIVRAERGDQAALARAALTVKKQRALLDPVWGGFYQYSTGGAWGEPHYEKLLTVQAANLEAYARAFARTRDPAILADARAVARYLTTSLSNSEGAFLVSQDADVNAHDQRGTFVDGDVYYRLGDAERRALGAPRVDDHVYGHENGLAIAAFAALHRASPDPVILSRARAAADLALRALVSPDGSVKRSSASARYLADAAALGRGLSRLAEVSGETRYHEAALSIAAAMIRDLLDEESGAFWDRTPDPAAAGVFARRMKSLAPNLLAARFLAALGRREAAQRALAAVCTPRAIDERGRMLGEVLLAFEEAKVIAWP